MNIQDNETTPPDFSKSLLMEIEKKAARFPLMGFIDIPIANAGSIISLQSSSSESAFETLDHIDLEEIYWYINMSSGSSHVMRFAHYIEHIYRSFNLNPIAHIEYIAYYGHSWIDHKKNDGFIVTTFSITEEKYIKRSALSGNRAITLYAYLLSIAKSFPGNLYERLNTTSTLPAFHDETDIDLYGNEKQKDSLNTIPVLSKISHITVIYNALWERLKKDEQLYASSKLNSGISSLEYLALLLNLTDTRFSDLKTSSCPLIDPQILENIVQCTLPDDPRDSNDLPVSILEDRDWGFTKLSPRHKQNIDRLLSCELQWTKWLYKNINAPVQTISDWHNFLTLAINLHRTSLDKFNEVSGYHFIGPLQHKHYLKQLLAAKNIIASCLSVSIERYLLSDPHEHSIINSLNKQCITLFVDHRLLKAEKAEAIYNFYKSFSLAYNRFEHVDNPTNADSETTEFKSRFLLHAQSMTISHYLNNLISVLSKLSDPEIYLKALIDAYHELQYKGHNPSISVHNVLMDNKYQIHSRDVNFIRMARKAAKQIDLIIEEYGEADRDGIVEDIKSYLRLEYQKLTDPHWTKGDSVREEKDEPVTYKRINIQRISTLLENLKNLNKLSTLEQRAAVHLRGTLLSAKRAIMELAETDELFQHDFELTLWDEKAGDAEVIFSVLETLIPNIITESDTRIAIVRPSDQGRPSLDSAFIKLAYPAPICETTLHKDQFPVVSQQYLSYYGTFILKLTDETVTAIERDAEQFRKNSDQIILLTETSSEHLVPASNDKMIHFSIKDTKTIKDYINGSTQDLPESNELKTWLSLHTWIIELIPPSLSTSSDGNLDAFVEKIYEDQDLISQKNIIYVGLPESSLMKDKSRRGFTTRSASNTRSIHYWPAIGFPDTITDLPFTYTNLLSFSLRYPGKLSYLVKMIRKLGESHQEELKCMPLKAEITLDIVRNALQTNQNSANEIAVTEIYNRVAEAINSNTTSEYQKGIIDSYLQLLKTTGTIMPDKDELLKLVQDIHPDQFSSSIFPEHPV